MHKTLKFSVLFFSILIIFSACSKDHDNGGPSSPTPDPMPSGELTVKIGGETFEATSVSARAGTDGTFRINATGNDDKRMQFALSNFIGNATYPLGPGTGNSLFYSYPVNGNQVVFNTDNGGGSLTVTGYSQSEQKFDGTFTCELTQSNGTSVLLFEEGELTDVPILTLETADPGSAKVYYAGEYMDADSVYARINNNFSIEIFLHLPGYVAPVRVVGVNYVDNPMSVTTFGFPYSKTSTLLSYFRPSQTNGEVSMTGDLNTVSGEIAMNDFDLQLNYTDIPIEQNYMDVTPGELVLTYDGNTVTFNQAHLWLDPQNAPQSLTQTFVAKNAAGDSLTFKYSYPGAFDPTFYLISAGDTGIRGTLSYYVNGQVVRSQFGFYNRNQFISGISYGFDPQMADAGAMRMRGVDIPE